MELWLPVLLGLSIGFVHYFGEWIDEHLKNQGFLLVSFSAGFTVSYFFISLLPETMSSSNASFGNIAIVIGFSSLYIVEELIYTREEVFGEIKYEFREVHTVLITSYHLVVGLLISFLASRSGEELMLFYLPVLLHTAVNSMAVKEMNEEILDNKVIKLAASFSTLIGVLIGFLLDIPQEVLFSLLGIIAGAFIYIVIHDALDPRRERPIGFISGVITFLALLAII